VSYQVEWEQDAAQALERLELTVARDIIKRIQWLAANFDSTKPRRPTGALKGYFKLRSGDYRVIYSVNRKSKILIIRIVGTVATSTAISNDPKPVPAASRQGQAQPKPRRMR